MPPDVQQPVMIDYSKLKDKVCQFSLKDQVWTGMKRGQSGANNNAGQGNPATMPSTEEVNDILRCGSSFDQQQQYSSQESA